MANGTAALALLPPSAPAPASALENPSTETAATIGAAMSAACAAVGMGAESYRRKGELTGIDRAWSGAMLARVVELRLATAGAVDFDRVARAECRRALMRRPDTILYRQFGADLLIDVVLTVTAKVASDELARAN